MVALGFLLAAALALVGLGSRHLEARAPVHRVALPAQAMVKSDGRRFTVPLPAPAERVRWPFRLAATDSSTAPSSSPHRVLEEGEPRGPAHAIHAEIARRGEGAFSVWVESVHFSSHDGSDPRHNGRRYEIELISELHPLVRFSGRAALVVSITIGAILAWWVICLAPLRLFRAAHARPRRQQPSSVAAIVAGSVLLLASGGAMAWILLPRSVALPIDRDLITPSEGLSWTASVAPLLAEADRRLGPLHRAGPSNRGEGPRQSRFRVLCDGVPLARHGAQVATIATLGEGRALFWHSTLYFSSPDGGDPRADDHQYAVLVDARPARWATLLLAAVAACGAILLVAALRGRSVARALAHLALGVTVIAVAVIIVRPSVAWIAGLGPVVLILASFVIAAARLTSRAPGRIFTAVRVAAARAHRVMLAALARLDGARGAVLLLLLVAASLLHAWAPLERPEWAIDSIRSMSLFEGRAQASDALGYLAGAETLRSTGTASAFASRRPLHAAWLFAVISATGFNLQAIIAVQALFSAIALWLAIRTMAHHIGPAVALAAGAFCLGFLQQFVAITSTEMLALPLALLSVGLLLPGVRRRSLGLVFSGSLALGMALIVRPGAMFVLPLVPLAVAWSFFRSPGRLGEATRSEAPFPEDQERAHGGSGSIRRGLAGGGIVALGCIAAVVLNALIAAAIGDPAAATNANFGYVLYGHSVGEDWTAGERWLAEHAPHLGEAERGRALVAAAMENIRREPSIVLGSFGRALHHMTRFGVAQLSSAFGDRGVLPVGESWWSTTPLLLWGILGPLVLVLRRRGHPDVAPLLIAIVAGVLLSVPVVWHDGSWRALAATIPFIAPAAAFFLAPRVAPALRRRRDPAPALAAGSLAAVICAAACVSAAAMLGMIGEPDRAPEPAIDRIARPRVLRVVEIAPKEQFRWFGPASLTLDGTHRALADWGIEVSIECLLSQVDHRDRWLLVQVMGSSAEAAMRTATLLVPPELRAEFERVSEPRSDLFVEWCGANPYLGYLGRVRGVSSERAREGRSVADSKASG